MIVVIVVLVLALSLIISGLIGGITGRRMRGSNRMVWVEILEGILGALIGGALVWGIIVGLHLAGVIGDGATLTAILVAAAIGAATLVKFVNEQVGRYPPKKLGSAAQPADVQAVESRGNVIDRPAPSHSAGGNIFISYASPDRPTAEALAKALMKEGWSVWWDRTIPPGKSFDEVIEAALSAAKCVIVLWSRASVASDWVKVEASDAAKRKILIPALIEEVTIPLEFRRIQSASLVDWRGASPHPGFDALVGSVASIVGKSKASATSI